MSFYMKNEKRIYNIHFFVTITILPPPAGVYVFFEK